jgi:predicted dehydrogenase
MIGIGVIGLGAFGEFQIQAFQGIPGVRVEAVASRNLAHAEDVARRYGVPAWFDSAEELCQYPEVDAVTVATEESRHVEPALAVLAGGKHVLVEKPLATTREDAIAIVQAAETSAGALMPGHIVRFETRFQALKRQVAAGGLGQIAAIHASRNRPRATLETYGRCHPALVTAIHDIDACLWMLGKRPVSVRAWHRLDRSSDGVYGIWGTFAFPGGCLATFEATWMMPDDTGTECADTFAVTGTRGSATIDLASPGLRILTPGRTHIPEIGYQPLGHDGIAGALEAELAHFVLLAEGRVQEPVVTPRDGLNAVVAAEAMIASAEADREVTIDWLGL